MSASLRTRDGALSVVASMAAHEKKSAEFVPKTMEEALGWASTNKISLKGEKHPVEKINRARAALQLPLFRIVAEKPGKAAAPKAARFWPRASAESHLLLAESEDELTEIVENCDGTLHRTITPEIAEWLLKLNTDNRPLMRREVQRFIKILNTGDWQVTGETIIVAGEGILNEGQHRLHAIKESGVSAPCDVRFGVPRSAFHATGTGRKRTVGDVLAIEGYNNTSTQAAIGRLVHFYDCNKMGNCREHIEPKQILDIVDDNDDIGEIAARIRRNKLPLTKSASFGVVLVVAARTAPKDQLFAFVDVVAGGLALTEEDPARCLHVKFRDLSLNRVKLRQEEIMAMTVKAWNAWLNDTPVQLKLNQSDRSNAGFPRVVDWKQSRRGMAAAA
jgi:hypothetical protein